MTRDNLLFAIIGILLGFIVGFIFASNIMQREAAMSSPSARTRTTARSPDSWGHYCVAKLGYAG
jgi:hypothetical protein